MKQKILFVINTLGHAGAEMAMLELMQRFDDSRYEISLYVLMAQGELIHRIPPKVKILNNKYSDSSVLSESGYKNMLSTICLAGLIRANVLRLLPYMVGGLIVMLKKKKIHKEKLLWRMISDGARPQKAVYDLAIAYLEGGSAYYVADHVKARKKVAFIHIDYKRAGYTRQLDKDCYLKYDRVFTVSGEVQANFLKVYPECTPYTQVFENLLDKEAIIRKSKETGGFMDDFDGIRLLTVGRLTHQKAYDIAIDAMSILKEEGYNVRWYVLGEGPERKRLEQKILKAELTQDFILLGARSNPYPYYLQTDIYIHATRFEGKSIAIQEAQILGCAIIASDCSGNREQLEHEKEGLLCELTKEEIARSIIKLILDEELRSKFSQASKNKKMNASKDIKQMMELLSDYGFNNKDAKG